jgi:hypothetical protein
MPYNLSEAALQYAGRGWRVFPCYPRAKEPLTRHGFKDATVKPSQIELWWSAHPDANVAIATGGASGLFVLDLDGADAIANVLELASAYGRMSCRAIVRTGRGFHIYCAMNAGEKVPCGQGKETGIDIRGDGGYVLAPPSIHPSGAIYTWVNPLTQPELIGIFV